MTLAQRKFIEKIYFEMYDLLLGYAQWVLENDALAEEAVQETFQTACMKPVDLLLSPNPQGWLFNTLKFTIKNSERSRNRTLNFLTEYTAAHGKEAFSED